MSTIIDGWTFLEAPAPGAEWNRAGTSRAAVLDSFGLSVCTSNPNDAFIDVPFGVVAELLRRGGWKVEAP